MMCVILSFVSVFYSTTANSYYTKDDILSLNLQPPLKVILDNNLNNIPVNYTENNRVFSADIMLFDIIPVKKANITVIPEKRLVPCAIPFGVKLYTQGVLVVAMSDVISNNENTNPAKDAGIAVGDIITHINEEQVNTNEEVLSIIEDSQGLPIKLKIKRNTQEFETILYPAKSCNENTYKAGLWVRDSSAGIGTLTYYDPENQTFAGLGHGICDIDTGEIMPLLTGDIVKAKINSVIKGQNGVPGELRGSFLNDQIIGTLESNTQAGVYGKANKTLSENEAVNIALKQDIKRGYAQILSTVSNDTPKYYDIEIEDIDYNSKSQTKNMLIKITSDELLEITGGIVQGMSGSPILQDGKLVGAVTHVLVNDPTRGYGIFIENMLDAAG
ncbi:MAG: SpoIVB peptidase [Clostridia bacterium]|nr:SpoIVB peptidase [Clostridia bacterium]